MSNTNQPPVEVPPEQMNNGDNFLNDFQDFGFDPREPQQGRSPHQNILAHSSWTETEIQKCLDLGAKVIGEVPICSGSLVIPAKDESGVISNIWHYPKGYWPGCPRIHSTKISIPWPPGASNKQMQQVLLGRKRFDKADSETVLFQQCAHCKRDLKLGDDVLMLPCGDWFDTACIEQKLLSKACCPFCKAWVFKSFESDELVDPVN